MTKIYLRINIVWAILLLVSSLSASELTKETTKALTLTPNIVSGKEIYELCATCHNKNGWGKKDGSFPVLAGQHRSVIIKQLADIRARNRENPTMFPFSGKDVLGGAQGLEDVAAYIAQLPSNPKPGHGDSGQVEKGEVLFNKNCSACHGKNGEGNADAFFPKIQGQHYAYLLRQLKWIRDSRRKNANSVMFELVKKMDDDTLSSIADYVSRMSPLEHN